MATQSQDQQTQHEQTQEQRQGGSTPARSDDVDDMMRHADLVNGEEPASPHERELDLMEADVGGDDTPLMGTPSDNTTSTDVLAGLVAEGHAASFGVVEGARLRCSVCATASPARLYVLDMIRRLEGASDPDDMVAVVACRCPNCRAAGTVVIGVGPTASGDDLDVLAALPSPSGVAGRRTP